MPQRSEEGRLPYIEWDLKDANLLPIDWQSQVGRVIDDCGRETVLTGASGMSREEKLSYLIEVIVVDGCDCKRNLPWLRRLYETDLRCFVSENLKRPFFIAKDERSSININCLRGIGARYESHVDSNPLTGLLFVVDADEASGGELIFKVSDNSEIRVSPRAGLFIAFDGRELPHFVSPLQRAFDRISIPMNYYTDLEIQDRPTDLDAYLYSIQQI